MADGFSPRADGDDEWADANERRFGADSPRLPAAAPSAAVVGWRDHFDAICRDLPRPAASIVRVKPHLLKGCGGMLFGWRNPELAGKLAHDRDELLFLQILELRHSSPASVAAVTSLYSKLFPSARDVRATGAHWEALGFQGSDPATDLRATGMLGVLQLHYFLDECPALAREAFRAAQDGAYEYPFALVGFNFSAFSVDCLQARGVHRLITAAAAEKPAPAYPAFEALGAFYVGCWAKFIAAWKSEPRRSVADFGLVKQRLQKQVLARPMETAASGAKARKGEDAGAAEAGAARGEEREAEFSSF